MPKLIDADKLKQHYAWWDNEDKRIFDTIIDLQSEAVVRCKDCKHYWKNSRDDVPMCLTMCLASPKDDAFCSEGERREDAETD